jgi:UDP-galactopyranose mutase
MGRVLREPDFTIVGSGLTGATIARTLHDLGHRVLVLERREHLGGNAFDRSHASGIRMHVYGPHYFRTSSERIWKYVNRFADFFRYEAVLMSWVGGRFEHWPVQSEYISRVVGNDWKPAFTGTPRNFEEASLAMMPASVYEAFVAGYTEKQWGVPCTALSPGLAGRFEVRQDGDARLKKSTWQGIPKDGYAAFMTRMLAGIPVLLNVDYLRDRAAFKARIKTVFTGPIDEFFDFELGRLAYRGQRREHEFLPRVDRVQPVAQVNYPARSAGSHVRVLEWKLMMEPPHGERLRGTLLTRETPFTPHDPRDYEYPFPDAENQKLYAAYAERARSLDDVLFCGRLGEYRYYDMDQAIGRALKLAAGLHATAAGKAGAHREPRALLHVAEPFGSRDAPHGPHPADRPERLEG